MASALAFLNHLRSLGIQVWLEGEKLRFRAPAQQLSSEIRAEMTQRKGELVELLRQGRAVTGPELTRAPREGVIPLTFAQQRLWFLDQLQPGVPAYNVYDVIEIDHELDIVVLRRALTELVRRHELLRTVFPARDGVPQQRILAPHDVPLPLIDVSGLDPEVAEREVQRLAAEEARASFDLARGPLLRVKLIKRAPAHYVWLLCLHHIISDDWSKKLLSQELELLYTAFRAGLPPPLPELPVQWADFALWQQRWLSGDNLNLHVAHWKAQLEGELPTLNLTADHPRAEPAAGRNGRFVFLRSLSAGLRALCDAEGTTLFMVLLAGYAVLLARYTRQQEVIVGSPISDRHRVETECLIGFLLNTLPLRVRVDERASFRELLGQVKETCLGGYAYQTVPYESLMQDLKVERSASGNPLFQTVLALLNTPDVQAGSSALWGSKTEPALQRTDDEVGPYFGEHGNGSTKFDLSLTLIEQGDDIWGRTEYNGDVFSEASISALVQRYQVLLRSAAANPGSAVADLDMMQRAERAAIVARWSRGPALAVPEQALQQLVERQARMAPDAVAIEDDGIALTYGELNARANRLAHFLRQRDAGAETCVGILLERSTPLFVAVLGVLKAGAAYVPMDTAYPEERLRMIAADARIDMLISNAQLAGALPDAADRLVCLERDAAAIAAASSADPDLASCGEQMACVLYTSGSTGRPKGVVLTHRGLLNYARDAARDYGAGGSDRILQFASIAFDASVEESLVAFCAGATLVLRPERMIDSTAAFVGHCARLRLTMMVLPTAYWHELISTLEQHPLPDCMRCIVIGGERAIPEKLADWQRLGGGRIQVFNTYGPTEGSIAVTRGLFPARAAAAALTRELPIGRPIANSCVYLLDQSLHVVPHGVPGELYLGGAALARGYLNQPGLTAERFVPDPLSDVPGARLYRTGDLARYLPDGTLEYLARVDAQVKIRGHRVEPREIELLLQEHDDVKDAVIVTREDEPGERRLIAYVVQREGGAGDVAELRSFLKSRLPAYMVPAAFVLLPVLPLNVNGKVNLRALPKPDIGGMAAQVHVEPRTPTERQLSDAWSSVLQIERIGVDANFFDLGGHSLLATRIIARINDALGIDLPLRRLFEAPTVAELSMVVDSLIQAPARNSEKLTSLRALPGGAAPGEEAANPGGSGMDVLLDGLEHLSDAEVEALLGAENDLRAARQDLL